MPGLIALIFALAAFTGTVVSVNMWFGPAEAPYNYDIMASAEYIKTAITGVVQMPLEATWAAAIIVLILPSLFVFLMVQGAFGSSR